MLIHKIKTIQIKAKDVSNSEMSNNGHFKKRQSPSEGGSLSPTPAKATSRPHELMKMQ